MQLLAQAGKCLQPMLLDASILKQESDFRLPSTRTSAYLSKTDACETGPPGVAGGGEAPSPLSHPA